MRSEATVIVKRGSRRRGNDDAGSGGAWKVAFADFTLAMMALFLVLWIVAMSSQEEREVVSESLRNYSMFDGSPSPFDLGRRPEPFDLEGYKSLIEGVANDILTQGNQRTSTSIGSFQIPASTGSLGSELGESFASLFESPLSSKNMMEVLADLIQEMGRQLGAMDNLAVEVVPQGLRVRLQDNENRQMFQRGGTRMAPFFEDMLLALAPVFSRMDNGIVVSGHTDSVPFVGNGYSNWELSGERAMVARKVMVAGGTPSDRILQVTAMADRVLADKDLPDASANRRIEILVLTRKAEAELLGLFDHQQPDSVLNEARRAAEQNQPVTR